jgi:Ca2+-binding EF-hand superfamily protein
MRLAAAITAAGLVSAVAVAAPPALPVASGKIEPGRLPFTARADAFVPGTRPHFLDQATLVAPPFKRAEADKVMDTFEMVFFARNRPVRVRVVAKVVGKSLNDRFEDHLKELFAAADRDGDGHLNRYETELIYSKTEFRSMLTGGYAFRGQTGAIPALEVVDKDDDGRVSFEEFADYYTPEVGKLTQTRPSYARANANDQLTPELFARLDKNKDGRLTEDELKEGEKILIPLDSDEDETVTTAELLATAVRPARFGAQVGEGMTGDGMSGRPGAKPNDDVQVVLGPLPGTLVQQLIKRFDTNGDYELSATEIGFAKATFEKLDANEDGKLTATELDAWRTGDPDAVVTLTAGDTQAECKAEAKINGDGNGVSLPKQTASDRAVLRVDKQSIDLAAAPAPDYVRAQQNPYGYLFPADKKFLTEKDLVGPQFQFLRVAFDPADFDGDGKLTREEFDRYFEMQQKTARLGLTMTHAVQVPNLFQLLDGNGDGRLGVKELRTAYERLLPLEPSDGKEITKGILQPSVMVRLGNTLYGAADQAIYNVNGGGNDPYGQPKAPTAGPVWFRKMDRNADGDISKGEFLGGKEEFDKLDTNADGLITLQEAEVFEAKARPKKDEKKDEGKKEEK